MNTPHSNLLLSPQNWPDYELLDSGDGFKLERFGSYTLSRPEPKALWHKSKSPEEWEKKAGAVFRPGAGFGKAGKEDSGTWIKKPKMPDQWSIRYQNGKLGFNMRMGLTSFKHVGVFPEQAPNWDYIFTKVQKLRAHAEPSQTDSNTSRPKVLNLFAYTGGASLAARSAGAEVVHVDAVKQVITWARENMEISGQDGIRWILEDAFKFVKRELRRNNRYQGIILDPPAYGHGPEGERWKLDECLFSLLQACGQLLDPDKSFMLLNLYSNGYSALLAENLVRTACGAGDDIGFGELYLQDSFGKKLPLSVFARLEHNL